MHEHWNKNLNVRSFLYDRKPKTVVECGAGSGENTVNLLAAVGDLGYKLIVINDDKDEKLPQLFRDQGVDWRRGISYLELAKLHDVDFCLIDTDHNYWTMRQELAALYRAAQTGCTLICHDTATFGQASGRMTEYHCGFPYPHEEIIQFENYALTILDAINEQILCDRWKIIAETHQSEGAMALEKI